VHYGEIDIAHAVRGSGLAEAAGPVVVWTTKSSLATHATIGTPGCQRLWIMSFL
jgi:hypothetical protein